ncbi:MAG: ribosome-associated translation inhibitor RaiA [Lentisphaeria bacterium]
MDITVSGRHLPVSEDLKGYVEGKLAKLATQYPKLTHARVILDHEKIVQKAEITLTGKNINLVAHAELEDMYAAIDLAADKLDKQLHKFVEKLHDHHGDPKLRDIEPASAGA